MKGMTCYSQVPENAPEAMYESLKCKHFLEWYVILYLRMYQKQSECLVGMAPRYCAHKSKHGCAYTIAPPYSDKTVFCLCHPPTHPQVIPR